MPPIGNPYQKPMQAWPKLSPYAHSIHLPKSGLTLYFYDAGAREAQPLLLIHGLGDEADTWRHVIPLLSARYRVIAPDLPGFGRSQELKAAYTVQNLSDILVELLDRLAVERATLAGHSLGAVIAHSIALTCPARAERLVLIDGGLVTRAQKLDPTMLLFLIPGLGEWMYNRLRQDPQAAYRTLEPFYNHLDRLPQADREFLFRRVNERVWSDRQRRAFLSVLRTLAKGATRQPPDLASRLAGLEVPTLVIWGEADRISAIDHGRALLEMQPTARLVVVPGAGPNVQQENPGGVAEAILAWSTAGGS